MNALNSGRNVSGTLTTAGMYTLRVDGTFKLTSNTSVPNYIGKVILNSAILVGGGGASGGAYVFGSGAVQRWSGAGGAGYVRSISNLTSTGITTIVVGGGGKGGDAPPTKGAGGSGNPAGGSGGLGEASTSTGGGAGGCTSWNATGISYDIEGGGGGSASGSDTGYLGGCGGGAGGNALDWGSGYAPGIARNGNGVGGNGSYNNGNAGAGGTGSSYGVTGGVAVYAGQPGVVRTKGNDGHDGYVSYNLIILS